MSDWCVLLLKHVGFAILGTLIPTISQITFMLQLNSLECHAYMGA